MLHQNHLAKALWRLCWAITVAYITQGCLCFMLPSFTDEGSISKPPHMPVTHPTSINPAWQKCHANSAGTWLHASQQGFHLQTGSKSMMQWTSWQSLSSCKLSSGKVVWQELAGDLWLGCSFAESTSEEMRWQSSIYLCFWTVAFWLVTWLRKIPTGLHWQALARSSSLWSKAERYECTVCIADWLGVWQVLPNILIKQYALFVMAVLRPFAELTGQAVCSKVCIMWILSCDIAGLAGHDV